MNGVRKWTLTGVNSFIYLEFIDFLLTYMYKLLCEILRLYNYLLLFLFHMIQQITESNYS